MTLSQRRILFGVFIVLFLCSAVLVMLYANGYRYHPQKKSVEKTGELVMDTKPSKATVFIDGEEVRTKKTPAQIKYVPSGDYRVELIKDKYFPWNMDISVYSGRSTVIKDIQLFPLITPSILIKEDEIRALGRLDGAHVYFATDSSLSVFNEQTKTFSVVYSTKALERDSIVPSPRGGRILFREGGLYRVVSSRGGAPITLGDQRDYRKIQWLSETELAGITKSGISAISALTLENKSTYLGDVIDIAANQDIFALVRGIDTTHILKYSPQNNRFEDSVQLPSLYTAIQGVNDGVLILSDSVKGNALFDTRSQEKLLLHLGNGKVIWQSRDQFALINDFELWIYDRVNGSFESSLLTRQGTVVDTMIFLPNNPYLFFVTQQKLKVIDTSLHGALNRYMLEGNVLGSCILSNDSDSLYCIGSSKEKVGLIEYDFEPQE